MIFYEHHYIPDFFNEKFHLDLVPDIHKSKILFLKLEYGRFLNNEKIRLLSSHYRNSRLFMPNKLQADLLGHKLLHIIPNFYRFKYKMDEPTKTVARHLLDYFQYIPEKHKAFFEKKEKELKAFVKKIQSKYLKTFKWGVITLSETEQQAKENKTMLTVLMDKKNMVCQTNQ